MLFYSVIGLFAATLGSLVGLGGGVVLVPALIYLGPTLVGEYVSHPVAVGTSLAVLLFTATSSTLTFYHQKRIDFRSGVLYFLGCGPGAILGAYCTQLFATQRFILAFGIFMLAMAILLILKERIKPLPIEWPIKRHYTDNQGQTYTYGYAWLPTILLGIAVGFISGLFGVGGGSLLVPAMVLLFRYPPHVATATSMFVMLLSAITGALTHASLGEVNGWMLLGLAPAALVGGWLGARIAGMLSTRRLLWVLKGTFILVALKMIAEGLWS